MQGGPIALRRLCFGLKRIFFPRKRISFRNASEKNLPNGLDIIPHATAAANTVGNDFQLILSYPMKYILERMYHRENSNERIVKSTNFFLSQMNRRTFLFQCFVLSRLSIWIRMVNQGSSYLFLAQIYSLSTENITFYKYVAILFVFSQISFFQIFSIYNYSKRP